MILMTLKLMVSYLNGFFYAIGSKYVVGYRDKQIAYYVLIVQILMSKKLSNYGTELVQISNATRYYLFTNCLLRRKILYY